MSNPQLFCFPYAGGNAEFFSVIGQDLPDVQLVAAEYAGHGSRRKEALMDDFGVLADDVFRTVQQTYSGGTYGLFGYSMGTITLVEVLVRILQSGMTPPACVFLAAHEPQTCTLHLENGRRPFDEIVKERMIAYGGIPAQLLNNKSFWRMYMPLYRADYTMITNYRFEELRLCCRIPAAVFYSETDTPFPAVAQWKNYFTGPCDFFAYTGTHFFIQEHHEQMAKIIRRMLTAETEVHK